jgi:outer membrane protein OmpA-like peptidoglycan-associated protein
MQSYKNIASLTAFLLAFGTLLAQSGVPQVAVQVKNETAANTKGLEFSPTFYEDGIVFISTNTAGLKKITDDALKLPAMSILRARRGTDGLLTAPEPFAKELSSLYHEGPVCFDRTAETVFFSRNAVIDGKEKIAKDKTQKMRLYWSKKTGGVWSEPTPLPFNTNEFDDCHPAISIDGDKLFFSSNRPGGLGGMDIYVSYKVGESWSEPVNLGAGVNTKGNDAFPFIHADNTLYFASDGQSDRKGGFDLYYAIPEGTQWTKPINMGEPFNTGGDDFGLIVDLNKINGYYSTNGNGGAGGDEIFNFHTENGNLDDYLLQNKRVPDRNLDLKVLVTEKSTGAPIKDAEVEILNYDGNNVIGRDEEGNLITVQNVNGQDVISTMPPEKGINGESDSKGRFATEVKPGNYVIIVSKKGYQTKQFRLPISKPGNELVAQLEKTSMAGPGKVQWNPSVFNYVTNAPLTGAMLVLTNKKTNERDTLVTDANGMVDYYLNTNTKYKVELVQAGRIIGSTDIDTDGWDAPNKIMMQNISVAPLLPGSIIELPNIYYNFNDATLRPDARKDLDLVVSLMKQQPAITVELASHTDCRGNDRYNEELSQRRANGVVEYLVTQGIGRNRLRPVGYGESEPRNKCTDGSDCTEQEHARNRRTEVRILAGVTGASMVYVDGQVGNADHEDPNPNVNTPPQRYSGGGKVTVTSADSDTYYVVAGSFLMENRANNQLATMRDAGYPKAEIVRFAGSTFYSVCVAKFKNRSEADALKRKLIASNVDAFVRAVQ